MYNNYKHVHMKEAESATITCNIYKAAYLLINEMKQLSPKGKSTAFAKMYIFSREQDLEYKHIILKLIGYYFGYHRTIQNELEAINQCCY